MFLKYALAATLLVSFVGILTSTAATIYYGARCMAAYNDPDTPKHKKLGMLLFPAFVLLPWAQPPDKRKYAHRFAICITCLAACVGIYEFAEFQVEAIE